MQKNAIVEALKNRILFFDGGMGTLLISKGLKAGENSALWSLSHPEEVLSIHLDYINAGADIITSNTFGASPTKTDSYRECIRAGLSLARRAADTCSDRKVFVAFDIGPSGRLLKPYGDFEFEDAVSYFKAILECADENADFVLFETFTDCIEAKAAVIAARECTTLPVFVSCSYDESSRLLTGSTPEVMATMLEGLSVDALGINCSVGPLQMIESVKRLCASTSLPVFVNPNAGFPKDVNGKLVYDVDCKSFSETVSKFIGMGVNAVGGCCGTTPEYISALRDKIGKSTPVSRSSDLPCRICSGTLFVDIGNAPVIIGERINPTGKPKLKEALKNSDYEYVINEALSQQDAGAHVLDVNVGLPIIDEKTVMPEIVSGIQTVCPLPLQIDTVDAEALENALRIYIGKPLINSVNGKNESLEAVLPLAAKYGGALIALTLDEDGIPDSAQKRLAIAEMIIKRAEEYGIARRDIIVDPLALAVSSDPESAKVTLDSIELIKKELGVCVSLGVSNISFGLPCRDMVNSTFFAMALEKGLDLAIINPLSFEMMKCYRSYMALKGYDSACSEYIDFASSYQTESPAVLKSDSRSASKDSGADDLYVSIVKGISESSVNFTQKLLDQGSKPLDIVQKKIIPALEFVGREFEAKRAFLPQLLMSAEAARASFEVVKPAISVSSEGTKGKIVLATVKGDLHDIGKNIVKTVLQSYGYDVIDLGKDVDPVEVLNAAQQSGARLVGLSALMTTTVPSMKETITLLKNNVPDVKVMVGGAVVNEECAKLVGADAYAQDAMSAVRIAEAFLN